MCCCVCCPPYRCALLLCAFEMVVSVTVWYNTFNMIATTFDNLQLIHVLLLIVLSGWLITLFASTGSLIAAHRQRRADFTWPRLVQQAGLLIIGFLLALIIFAYFSGGAQAINSIILNTYESVVLDHPLGKEERKEASNSLRYSFILLILLDFFFICYMAFGLAITRKFQQSLSRDGYRNPGVVIAGGPQGGGGASFKPLGQHQPPSAPPAPPPYNPAYHPV